MLVEEGSCHWWQQQQPHQWWPPILSCFSFFSFRGIGIGRGVIGHLCTPTIAWAYCEHGLSHFLPVGPRYIYTIHDGELLVVALSEVRGSMDLLRQSDMVGVCEGKVAQPHEDSRLSGIH